MNPQLKNLRSADDSVKLPGLEERSVQMADDIGFEDRGLHELKGLSGPRQLWAARSS